MATVFPDTPSSNCSSRHSVHLRCASLLDLTEDKSCAGTPRVWPSCERNTTQISSGLWQFQSTCTRNGVSQIGPGRRRIHRVMEMDLAEGYGVPAARRRCSPRGRISESAARLRCGVNLPTAQVEARICE